MMKSREELTEVLVPSIKTIKKKRKVVDEIKSYLAQEYGMLAGTVQEVINNPLEYLSELETRELYLITEQVYNKTGNIKLNPEIFFTEVEKREAHLYEAEIFRKTVDLPKTFETVTKLGENSFSFGIDAKTLNEFLDNQLLHYDPELQRELTVVTGSNGEVRYEPTIVKKNVETIAKLMNEGLLEHTNLVWNAMSGSGDDGEELVYDDVNKTLTILKGTKLAIVDGYHRHKGVQQALRANPDLDFKFSLNITNYNKKRAQGYQAQIAEQTPISKNRKLQLKDGRYADGIVTRLMQESDLKNKISQDQHVKNTALQLVSYNVMADSIDKYFDMVSKKDATLVGDYLIEFFDELLGSYPKEFITNIKETKKISIMNHNNMFVGYIILASKMFNNELPVTKLTAILSKLDFNKNNEKWLELGVLNEKGNMEDTLKSRKAIADYFLKLEII